MRWLRILILAGVLQALLGVGVALADTIIQIEITASGNASASCPAELTATPISDYQVTLTWENATGNDTLGTVIRVDYGAYPTGPTSGEAVYSGNGTSTTHSVNMGVLTEDIYYRAWTIYAGPTYSVCYTSAMVEVPGAAPAGIGGTIDMTGLENVLDDMVSLLRVGLILAFPAIIGLIGAFRHSLGAYLVGIVGMGVSLSYVNNEMGIYLTMPVLILITALLFGAILDAWHERIVII